MRLCIRSKSLFISSSRHVDYPSACRDASADRLKFPPFHPGVRAKSSLNNFSSSRVTTALAYAFPLAVSHSGPDFDAVFFFAPGEPNGLQSSQVALLVSRPDFIRASASSKSFDAVFLFCRRRRRRGGPSAPPTPSPEIRFS